MKVTEVIAIYAAVLSTATGSWQVLMYWDTRRPKLLIRCRGGLTIENEEHLRKFAALLLAQPQDITGLPWWLTVEIVNAGRAKVQLRTLNVYQHSGASGKGWNVSEKAAMPRWLDPGEALAIGLNHDEMRDANPGSTFDVAVDTGVGRSFRADFSILDRGSETYVTMTSALRLDPSLVGPGRGVRPRPAVAAFSDGRPTPARPGPRRLGRLLPTLLSGTPLASRKTVSLGSALSVTTHSGQTTVRRPLGHDAGTRCFDLRGGCLVAVVGALGAAHQCVTIV
jgi:hypothetical protein